MHFDAHPHPTTAERSWLFVDWNPADGPLRPRTIHGLPATPLQLVRICADRVELEYSWCVESGHMSAYESEPLEVFPRATSDERSAVIEVIRARFSAVIADEARAIFDDPSAFATG